MIVIACLALLIVALTFFARGLPHGPLDAVERIYLILAPIPAVLSLLLPGLIVLSGWAPREWSIRLSVTGGWLSLALILVGALLLVQRSRRQRVWDRRFMLALAVAALPAASLVLIVLMTVAARGG